MSIFNRHPVTPVGPPPAPPLRAVAVVVPVANADVFVDDVAPPNGPGGHAGKTNDVGYVEFVVTPLPITFVRIEAGGYKPYQVNGLQLPPGNVQLRIGVPADPARPQDVLLPPLEKDRPVVLQRSPLTMPSGSFDRVMPWTPPASRDFLRADAWGVPVFNDAGEPLPFVAGVEGSGGSSEHPERLLTGLDYKYDRDVWWPHMLFAHASRGYTHWLRWWPNARADGGNSIEQFVDDCLRIKQVIPFVIVTLGSKVFDPRDQRADDWKRRVGPLIDALLKADACDEFIPAFEIDSFNIPGRPTIDYCKFVGQQAHAAGKSCWLHFFPEHTSWFADGDGRGRFGFWDDLGGDVDGLMYQTGARKDAGGRELRAPWTIEETQARIVDTLSQFGRQGNRHKFRFCEDLAWLQFSFDRDDVGQAVDETAANVRGYLACCTIDNVARTDAKVWGYGNGARGLQGELL